MSPTSPNCHQLQVINAKIFYSIMSDPKDNPHSAQIITLLLENFNLYIYLVLSLGAVLILASFTNYYVLCNSGQNIHDMSVSGVIQSPIRFFDTNPAGRILNRFSKDMGQLRSFYFQSHFKVFFRSNG